MLIRDVFAEKAGSFQEKGTLGIAVQLCGAKLLTQTDGVMDEHGYNRLPASRGV